MQIILLKKIINLGNPGDQVSVKPGYARNFLFPRSLAIIASEENVKHFEYKKIKLEEKLKYETSLLVNRCNKIKNLKYIEITCKAGLNGKLFGSVGARQIAEKIKEKNVYVMKHEIKLVDGPLRLIGSYEVKIQINQKVFTTINVILKSNI